MIYFERWKIIAIAAICFLGLAYATPNLIPRDTVQSLPAWIPHKQVNLGLDLQGGVHLLIEVDLNSVFRDRVNSIVDSVRSALRRANIGYVDLTQTGNGVSFTVRSAADLEKAREAVRQIDPDVEVRTAGNTITLTLTDQAIRDRKRAAVEQSIEILHRRIDPEGVKEPVIQRQGEDRILVQVPGEKDPEQLKRVIGRTAKMTFRLVDENVTPEEARTGRLPPTDELLPGEKKDRDSIGQLNLYVVQKRVMVSGDSLTDAKATLDPNSGGPVVSFRFDSVGARKFGQATKENVGKRFAIVLDNEVISAPVIREPITGGSGIISGRFTTQEVNDLALLLRAGALPAPLKVLEERTVGPGLGQDSIEAGTTASILALIVVAVFMIAMYGLFGLVATIAVIVNLILILALMSLLGATLTLPGIAGIALTIGMAVDANVLIYERMREEQRNGRTPVSAIDAGFRRAYATIVDANLTHLIAGGLLYFFGTGPIRGFAVTLIVGIATSLFTAVTVTRLITVTWLRWTKPQRLPL